jgi:hypothetical protein
MLLLSDRDDPDQSFSSFAGSSATYPVASLMFLTVSFSALVWNTRPLFLSSCCKCSVTSLPATSILLMLLGMANPWKTGTACETPSPESRTSPVVFPDAYSDSTAWTEVYRAGTLNVSNNIWAAVSRFSRGFSGGSVRSTGCYVMQLALAISKWTGRTHVFADSLQAFCVDILPYSLHVIPVGNDAVLQRIIDLEQPPILLRLRSDEQISLQCACHCPHMFRASNIRREEAFGYVFACEPGSDGPTTVVDDYGGIV